MKREGMPSCDVLTALARSSFGIYFLAILMLQNILDLANDLYTVAPMVLGGM
jgi:hypothetical protein